MVKVEISIEKALFEKISWNEAKVKTAVMKSGEVWDCRRG